MSETLSFIQSLLPDTWRQSLYWRAQQAALNSPIYRHKRQWTTEGSFNWQCRKIQRCFSSPSKLWFLNNFIMSDHEYSHMTHRVLVQDFFIFPQWDAPTLFFLSCYPEADPNMQASVLHVDLSTFSWALKRILAEDVQKSSSRHISMSLYVEIRLQSEAAHPQEWSHPTCSVLSLPPPQSVSSASSWD